VAKTSTPKDERLYEPPSAEALEAEFDGWEVWEGVSHKWYARKLKTSPPWVAGPCYNLAHLRQAMIGCIWRHSRQADARQPAAGA
jgi:hypothetical protein